MVPVQVKDNKLNKSTYMIEIVDEFGTDNREYVNFYSIDMQSNLSKVQNLITRETCLHISNDSPNNKIVVVVSYRM